MKNGIHFISGLPRSGSTLLAAILRQNPRFHAAMTSPVGAMYMALESAMSRRNETAVFIKDTQRRNILRGAFANYYSLIEDEKMVFETNRIWCAKLPALTQLFPEARVICCVRNIAWIMDSIERLVRKNAFELSGMFGFEPGNTVYTRLNRVAMSDGLVGFALDALKEGFFGEQGQRLVLVEYEALARAPYSTIQHLYTVLESPSSPMTSKISITRPMTSTSRSARRVCIPSAGKWTGSNARRSCRRNCSGGSITTCSGGSQMPTSVAFPSFISTPSGVGRQKAWSGDVSNPNTSDVPRLSAVDLERILGSRGANIKTASRGSATVSS